MTRVGLLKVRVTCFRESERSPLSLSPFDVGGLGGAHIEVVGMHPQNPEDAAGLSQTAADDLLEIGNTPKAPRLHISLAEEIHAHKDVDGCHDICASQDRFNSSNYLGVILVVPIVV